MVLDTATLRVFDPDTMTGARCCRGVQQNRVLGSVIDAFGDEFTAHANRTAPPVEPMLIAELIDIRDHAAVLDERHPAKQPDWTYNPRYSRATPFDILSAGTPPWGGDR